MGESIEKRDFTVHDSKHVYKRYRINVFQDKVTLPNGLTATRDVVRTPPAVAILGFIDEEHIVLLKQFRYSVAEWIYEIPAGVLEKGESPDVSAIRELEEETGYKAHDIRLLGRFYSSPGFCDEEMHVFLAHKLERTKPNPEDYECLKAEIVSLEDALKMAVDGRISDGKTLAALGLFLMNRK
ncbi:MAG: NUDIX hydrolase [Planctomycetota bacterium]|jgi:ADP-ribose pyrophosphatase